MYNCMYKNLEKPKEGINIKKFLRRFSSFVLVFAFAVVLCGVSTSANGVATSSKAMMSTVTPIDYALSKNGSNVMRGTESPSERYNLSNNPYELSGTFTARAFTNYYFEADGNGEIEFDVTIDYTQVQGDSYHLQKGLTVELWKKSWWSVFDELVDSKSATALPIYSGGSLQGYETWINCSGTFTGLETGEDDDYYIVLTKANDGLTASISGTISHP